MAHFVPGHNSCQKLASMWLASAAAFFDVLKRLWAHVCQLQLGFSAGHQRGGDPVHTELRVLLLQHLQLGDEPQRRVAGMATGREASANR